METKLTSDAVRRLFSGALFKKEELATEGLKEDALKDAVIVEGVVSTFGFHRGRLQAESIDIRRMVSQLPKTLETGETFLRLCVDIRDELWGQQAEVEMLMAMAEGLGLVRKPWGRDKWHLLPGGVPVFIRCAESPKHRSPMGIHPAWNQPR